MAMRAGKMDRRITLQRKSSSGDSFGQPIETWADISGGTVWAEVSPVSGNERWLSQQMIAEADTLFRIRYMAGLTPLDRVVYDGRTYDVKSVIEIGRREGLDISAKTRAE